MIEVKDLTFSYAKTSRRCTVWTSLWKMGKSLAFWDRMAPGNQRPKKS